MTFSNEKKKQLENEKLYEILNNFKYCTNVWETLPNEYFNIAIDFVCPTKIYKYPFYKKVFFNDDENVVSNMDDI